MLGLEIPILAMITVAVIVGGIIKGITGIGLPIVSISIVISFNLLPPREAIAMVVIPILVTNGWQAFSIGGLSAPLKRFWPTIVVFLSFLWLGSSLLSQMDTRVLFGVLGICVAIFASSNLMRPRPHPLTPTTERWGGPVAGMLGGLLGGVTTIWGPPLMMYFVLLKLQKDEWVRTIGLVWFCGALPLCAFYWSNGVLNEGNVWLSAYACIPGMIGILIGERLRARINEDLFRKVMLACLFVIGLNLIRRALF